MSCKVCKKETLKIINFGNFPVAHKFKKINRADTKFNLTLCICKKCNLVQLKKPFPLKELKPKYNWIKYNEPEEHLDKLVRKILKLKNFRKNNIIAGAGYKEISTLQRFNRLGFKNTWILDSKKDLNIRNKNHNLETIQDKIAKINVKKIIKNKKLANIFIARHILEHTYSTIKFLNKIKTLVCDDGYIVIEVPDCEKSLQKSDYAMLWEEHLLYFTENSLKNLFLKYGFKIEYFERYNYSYENVLIFILKKNNYSNQKNILYKNPKINFNLKKLRDDRRHIYKKIQKISSQGYKICLFGTGHVACVFVNLLKLNNLIDLVVDDDFKKSGMYLPNLSLKIKKTSTLKKFDKLFIILGVNSESEKKIIKKFRNTNSKIKFCSVYNNSKFSFRGL